MAASSLLVLIDDIAAMLDDVAILSKVAAKKTSGVLGDDLALNAEQVSGVRAERELPVVWAVAKGSFKNKFILVPSALIISAIAPWAIVWLLVIGGLFLCFEGFEKIVHKYLHDKEEADQAHNEKLTALADPNVNLAELEQDKIKGAIRTDFILSAEIIVIILGTVADTPFSTQVTVLSALAIVFTVGVYGLVAAIVKLDDAGLYLLKNAGKNLVGKLQKAIGKGLLLFAPFMMKSLTIIGTIAMFMVGGGILVHNIGAIHHVVAELMTWFTTFIPTGNIVLSIAPIIADAIVGLIAGALVLAVVIMGTKIKSAVQN